MLPIKVLCVVPRKSTLLRVLGDILANVRRTYVSPPGQGFLPRETAKHHQQHVVPLIAEALKQAKIDPEQLDCVCFTQGN